MTRLLSSLRNDLKFFKAWFAVTRKPSLCDADHVRLGPLESPVCSPPLLRILHWLSARIDTTCRARLTSKHPCGSRGNACPFCYWEYLSAACLYRSSR